MRIMLSMLARPLAFCRIFYSLYLKSDAALTLTSNSTDIVFRTYDANGNMTENNTVTRHVRHWLLLDGYLCQGSRFDSGRYRWQHHRYHHQLQRTE